MITPGRRPTAARVQRAWRRAGFTLAEMMVATTVFAFVVIGFVYVQMFGMRQDELVNSKVGASELARLSFNDMANDIRAAKIWQIGNGNLAAFTAIPLGTNQQGNAIKVSLTTDTNQYYMYYFNTNTRTLYRGHSGSAATTCVAQYLTNTMYFQAQDYRGNPQTTLTHKGVIDVLMQFCQFQYPITKIGPGYYYNYYKVELRLTPHVPDGP
jgi:prepilin-type N-terminal cleavage/methylation domain-containing protein